MANQNTSEYMDKIKTRLFENLRMLPHAPGVQMANIPEDGVILKEDTDDANPDERNPVQDRDRQMEHQAEFVDGRPGNNKDRQSFKDREEHMELDKEGKKE